MILAAATVEDTAVLAAIHAAAFEASAAWDAGTFATLLQLDGVFGLRAAESAFILARRTLDEAEILTLAVRPEARRQGLAAALVETAIVAAAVAGAKTMFLEVGEANAPALALYAGMGFMRIGVRRNYYAPGKHALALSKSLVG
ncbi:MAG: ribosomal-protein-alanine acetyltransferase [Rubritepida sp.]|nr:ribosomal-protein-alanine acetyltransferase [Rubritepida sp.]